MTNETTNKKDYVNGDGHDSMNVIGHDSMNNGDGFTIQPLTTSIDIKNLRQLIGSWHRNGVKYADIPRILRLYLGEPAWMNQNKEYSIIMFGEMARGLKYRSRQEFLDTLIKCTGFCFIWKDEQYGHQANNLIAFYTPIWHKENETGKKCQSDKSQGADDMCNLPNCTRYINNNNYYIIKNNIKKKDIINNSVCNLANCAKNDEELSRGRGEEWGKGRNEGKGEGELDTKRITAAAQQLIRYIATDPDAYAKVVKPINEMTLRLMPELPFDPSSSCPATDATVRFINQHLYPYILQHGDRLMQISTLLGQSCWLANLIKKEFMLKKIATAVNDARRYMARHPQERLRANRSENGLEYQDPETGQRFYDTLLPDGTRKQHRIPQEAPPRVQPDTVWSKHQKAWVKEIKP